MYFLDKFKKLLLLLIIFLVGGMLITWSSDFLLEPRVASAQTGCSNHNVEGWAWSENVGWMSFSCENTNAVGSGEDYGVDLEQVDSTTYKFKGWVWSRGTDNDVGGVGWLTFNRKFCKGTGNVCTVDADCPGGICYDVGSPPAAPDYGTYLAQLDTDTREVSGWARACGIEEGGSTIQCGGGGWNGWIHLSDTDYGIYAQSVNSSSHFYDWAAGWDDNDKEAVIGWISFNCANCEGNSSCDLQDTCNGSHPDYYVSTDLEINQPPTVTDMVDPDSAESYCGINPGEGLVSLEWRYNDADGDEEQQWELEVRDGNGNVEFTDSLTNPTCVDDDPSGAISCVNTTALTVPDEISYGKTYSWDVKVYDDQGNDSGWITGPGFDTPAHAWPWPDFDWTPSNPVVNQTVEFNPDESKVYNDQGDAISPPSDGYSWEKPGDADFVDGTDSSSQYPHIQFSSTGSNDIRLTITDTDGYSCELTKTVNVTLPLPGWKEVKPE